ncbi:MAG TPA: histidine kinase, partial [Cytophagales bacterium]|nr:histidine kinase [Cytophagales bacterium]
MGYRVNYFRIGVWVRVLLIAVILALLVLSVLTFHKYIVAAFIALLLTYQIIELIYYLENTNRKLARFLDSVRYSDFASAYSIDSKLGRSFQQLNSEFNSVLEAFRRTRAEKEENLLYLNTVVQHVKTGLMAVEGDGHISLINTTARKLLDAPQMHNLKEIQAKDAKLYELLSNMKPGDKITQRYQNKFLSLHATSIRLQGNDLLLIAFQDIQSELQIKEVESWQKLTRVLRHEIMNSITPIASLTSTLNDILREDITKINDQSYQIDAETIEDIEEGLDTIESRSHGLVQFVDAYRDYTTIPQPKFAQVPIFRLFDHMSQLLKGEFMEEGIDFACENPPDEFIILADAELVEMVLINLLKNAREAIREIDNPKISVQAYLNEGGKASIDVKDNGPGIIPEAIDKIFIPFYTTKKNGSGIGLALSRQIMQMHGGNLTVESEPHIYTI